METELLKNNAKAFKKSAERSLEQRKLPNGQIQSLAVPAIVNFAFSIELYLKYLLIKNGAGFKKVHKLFDLFNLLNTDIKQEIIKSTTYNQAEFELLLEQHTNAFIDWRYLHEKKQNENVDLEFMRRLLDSIERIADKS